jgi:hypothetical protein
MGNKVPQPTGVLIARLQRLARVLDRYSEDSDRGRAMRERSGIAWHGFANTCWQSAARLEDLEKNANANAAL